MNTTVKNNVPGAYWVKCYAYLESRENDAIESLKINHGNHTKIKIYPS